MTTEQPKVAQQATTQEQQPPQLPPGVVYPYNGAPYPHGTPAYPPFYSYPPPAEGQATENSVPPPPPPGFMMFPHPPQGLTPPQPQSAAAPTLAAPIPAVPAPAAPAAHSVPVAKPKRKQVKMACTNCAAACKRCDEHRPCERCTKYGITDTCVDGQRKERKKGIKRGPYKRKNKDGTTEGEWSAGAASPPPNPQPPQQHVPVIQAIPHQLPNGEAFYPIYYPPGVGPYLAIPPPHDGEGAPNGQPPLIPYYIPGGYPPPFAHYPFPMPPPPPAPPAQQQPAAAQSPPQTVDPAVTSSSTEPSKDSLSPMAEKTVTNGVLTTADANDDVAAGKKRKKSGDKSKKAKKAKTSKGATTTVEPSAISVAADEDAEEEN